MTVSSSSRCAAGQSASVMAVSAYICSFFFRICSYCALLLWYCFTLQAAKDQAFFVKGYAQHSHVLSLPSAPLMNMVLLLRS